MSKSTPIAKETIRKMLRDDGFPTDDTTVSLVCDAQVRDRLMWRREWIIADGRRIEKAAGRAALDAKE